MRIASMALLLAMGLAACTETPAPTATPTTNTLTTVPPIYQARVDQGPNGEPIDIRAVNIAYLTERNKRQQVAYNGPEEAGTIVVDPYARFLYIVGEGGQAMRFGVAVGKAGTGFEGSGTIRRKQVWPSWVPTANMVRTNPELYGPVRDGLPGGPENPLGSRALYLYQGNVDTMYRIHGTMDPSSIGKATSAGCIRMFNQDIMDIFNEVPMGTRVVVRSPEESLRLEGPLIDTPEGYKQSAVGPASGPGTIPNAAVPNTVAPNAAAPVAATPVATAPVSPVESAVPTF